MGHSHQQPGHPSPADQGIRLAIFGVLLVAGTVLGWNAGKLPEARQRQFADGQDRLAGDLALYRDVIAQVREGRDYYDAAGELLPRYGFPTTSPLNWRLPTYAWLFSRSPNVQWVRAPLIVLSVFALVLAGWSQWRTSQSRMATLIVVALLFGTMSWAIDGQAFLAQEPWVATLILISVSTFQQGQKWSYVSVGAGVTALFFRELALPYCLIAMLIAAWRRDWPITLAWCVGVALFLVYFAWHVHRVQVQLAASDEPFRADLGQWLRLGGLDFVLLTVRMNQWFFSAPGWILWWYLLAAMIGLSSFANDRTRLCCGAALTYVLVFAILGRPENFYWGLLTAPLLPWGIVLMPDVLRLTKGTHS